MLGLQCRTGEAGQGPTGVVASWGRGNDAEAGPSANDKREASPSLSTPWSMETSGWGRKTVHGETELARMSCRSVWRRLSACLPVSTSFCLYVCICVLLVCLSACLPVSTCFWLFIYICPFFSACLSACLSLGVCWTGDPLLQRAAYSPVGCFVHRTWFRIRCWRPKYSTLHMERVWL